MHLKDIFLFKLIVAVWYLLGKILQGMQQDEKWSVLLPQRCEVQPERGAGIVESFRLEKAI